MMKKTAGRIIIFAMLCIVNILFHSYCLVIAMPRLFAVFDVFGSFDNIEKIRMCLWILQQLCWICFFLKVLVPFRAEHKKILKFSLIIYICSYIISETLFSIQAYLLSLKGIVVFTNIYYVLFSLLLTLCPVVTLLIGLVKKKSTEKIAAIFYIIIFITKHIQYISSAPEMYTLTLTYISVLIDLAFIALLLFHPILSEPILSFKKIEEN